MADTEIPVARVVALGASNLTRGFPSVVSAARTAWGPDVDVLATLGLGRSYGAPSSFLVRRLPGILESGLWRQLETTPKVPTRALVTDVGNDILYGFPPARILEWVEDALVRLGQVTDDIVVTGLPMANIRRLSPLTFLVARAVLTPAHRVRHEDAIGAAEQVHAGLQRLAAARGARFLPLRAAWYGVDPVHIRPMFRREAWQEILGVARPTVTSRVEAFGLHAMRPERQWICGIEQRTVQRGARLTRGGRIWLY